MDLDARLYLLFTPALCRGADRDPGAPFCVLEQALDGGVPLVQLRCKGADKNTPAPASEVAATLERTLEVCSRYSVPVVVNDHVALAAQGAAGVAGAHVGQDDMPAREARALLQPGQWLGVSTHDLDQVRAAEAGGADHLGFGPCFPTETKGYGQGQPEQRIAEIAVQATLPVFFLGGLNGGRIRQLRGLGASRFAVSGAILGAERPDQAAQHLLAAATG